MAHPVDQRLCSTGALRLVLLLVPLFLIGCVVGPPLFWHSKESSIVHISCPSCDCDCSLDDIISFPLGVFNSSFADCGKDDPEMNEEMKKDIITLLSEEITLQRNVTSDSLERTEALITDARKTSSHYQREAEKCNIGIETCEEAREKAEAAVMEERKLSAIWERRAREHGWN